MESVPCSLRTLQLSDRTLVCRHRVEPHSCASARREGWCFRARRPSPFFLLSGAVNREGARMGYKTASALLDELDGRSSSGEMRTSSGSDELGGVIFICRCVSAIAGTTQDATNHQPLFHREWLRATHVCCCKFVGGARDGVELRVGRKWPRNVYDASPSVMFRLRDSCLCLSERRTGVARRGAGTPRLTRRAPPLPPACCPLSLLLLAQP